MPTLAAALPRLPPPQVKSLKKQHNILSAETEGAASQLAAAQAEAAELREALESMSAQQREASQAGEKAAAEVRGCVAGLGGVGRVRMLGRNLRLPSAAAESLCES